MIAPHSRAWAYWLARVEIVERAATYFARSKGLDVDDVRQSLVVRLVEVHDRFDETRSSASTWASWQCRAVVSNELRSKQKRLDEQQYDDEQQSSDASQRQIEARVEAQQVLARATRDEREAVRARVEGWTEREVRARLNCAPFSVRRRVARLAERVAGDLA